VSPSAKPDGQFVPERNRASRALLEELGWLTVQWARLEAYVDLITAYLHKQHSEKPLPRPFNGRVKFIRSCLSHPLFFNLRADGVRVLDDALKASRRRNHLVHGIVVQWIGDDDARNTLLKSTSTGYVAVQDISVGLAEVEATADETRKISSRLFGLLERMKSAMRLLAGDERFHEIARLDGDRD
jgi:hypothetical protein